MIIEERIYTCHVGKAKQYVRCTKRNASLSSVRSWAISSATSPRNSGPSTRVVHLWAYEDLNDRARRRGTLLNDERGKTYAAKVQPLVLTQENKILVPAPFSPWAQGPAYAPE